MLSSRYIIPLRPPAFQVSLSVRTYFVLLHTLEVMFSICLTLIACIQAVLSSPRLPLHPLQQREVTLAFDPFDHSWIHYFTAIGDSFASGLGAGHAVKAGPGVRMSRTICDMQ